MKFVQKVIDVSSPSTMASSLPASDFVNFVFFGFFFFGLTYNFVRYIASQVYEEACDPVAFASFADCAYDDDDYETSEFFRSTAFDS